MQHLSDPNLSVDSIAETLNLSRSTLYRKWKQIEKKSLNDYIIQCRLEEAISLITEKKYTFSVAASLCGFQKPSYFSVVFKKNYGITPSDYFNKNE